MIKLTIAFIVCLASTQLVQAQRTRSRSGTRPATRPETRTVSTEDQPEDDRNWECEECSYFDMSQQYAMEYVQLIECYDSCEQTSTCFVSWDDATQGSGRGTCDEFQDWYAENFNGNATQCFNCSSSDCSNMDPRFVSCQVDFCYDSCADSDTCWVSYEWERSDQTDVTCDDFWEWLDTQEPCDDCGTDVNETCYMNCQEFDYSGRYDLEFAWMRECVDTCTGDSTCFMEWSADGTDFYQDCQTFYDWLSPDDQDDNCLSCDPSTDCSSQDESLHYCQMTECEDFCTGNSTCTVEVATADGSAQMNCTEFYAMFEGSDDDDWSEPEECLVCEYGDCQYLHDEFTYCQIANCSDTCTGQTSCYVDFNMDRSDQPESECDAFFEWLDLEDDNDCYQTCWEEEDCTANSTWYSYCSRSNCYDNCTWETTCFVDWIDQNGFQDSTDCDSFDNFYNQNDTFDGQCVYECRFSYDCTEDYDWFEVCDRYDCYDNCTFEYECVVDWVDQTGSGDVDTCEDFDYWFGNDTNNETDTCGKECGTPYECPDTPYSWCQMQMCFNSCDAIVSPDCEAEWFDNDQFYHSGTCDEYYEFVDNDPQDCEETCSDPYVCPDSTFDDCTMTECFNSCDPDGESRCWAGWSDFEGTWREASCEDYYKEVECIDYDVSQDECVFQECSDDGNCWQEICNQDSENECAKFSCQIWKYSQQDDYWSQEDCPKDQWNFGEHFYNFAEIYNETFRDAFTHTCPEGQCFENFTSENLPIFDTHSETIDEFLADERATEIAHDAVNKTSEAMKELGYDVNLNFMHSLLEQEDTEGVTDAIDGFFTMFSQGWLNKGTVRKGSRSKN